LRARVILQELGKPVFVTPRPFRSNVQWRGREEERVRFEERMRIRELERELARERGGQFKTARNFWRTEERERRNCWCEPEDSPAQRRIPELENGLGPRGPKSPRSSNRRCSFFAERCMHTSWSPKGSREISAHVQLCVHRISADLVSGFREEAAPNLTPHTDRRAHTAARVRVRERERENSSSPELPSYT
jgi:hypothetical protein